MNVGLEFQLYFYDFGFEAILHYFHGTWPQGDD
jgi:hypothetical protein